MSAPPSTGHRRAARSGRFARQTTGHSESLDCRRAKDVADAGKVATRSEGSDVHRLTGSGCLDHLVVTYVNGDVVDTGRSAVEDQVSRLSRIHSGDRLAHVVQRLRRSTVKIHAVDA